MDNTGPEQSKSDMFDMAIIDMEVIVEDMGALFQRLKKAKFDYLSLTCELYTKMDLPTVMMDTCDREFKELVPTKEQLKRKRGV
jgi:hypothetical protein